MEILKFQNFTFFYPGADREALSDINLAVKPSEFVVVCGRSGCGKTTLLRQIKKSMIPYGKCSGDVLYNGKDTSSLEDRVAAAEIGFVQQSPDNQIVTDQVWHELAFGLESLGLPNSVIRSRVAEMASFFNMESWFRKNTAELSGGQKQILNLASVMVMQPKLLVLDEPTSQLDPIAASEFIRTLYRLNQELGTAVIISEHRLEELFPLADRVVVMDGGTIEAYGAPGEAASVLKASDSNMFGGLPSVVRIFEDVKNGHDEDQNVPLTIRDGRLWLEEELAGHELVEVLPDNAEENNGKEVSFSADNIWFRYSRNAPDILRGFSLEVHRGELTAVLGGNGAGKSTAVRVIAGLQKPQCGKVTANGKMAVLPQNPQALFTEITAEEELLEALYGMSANDSEKVRKVSDMLELMEIKHLAKAHPYDLSGGEQQRLALGKILLQEPDILILDEPTKGLDPFFKKTLAEIFARLMDKGISILMVSHDIEFCAEYADRCAMLFDGEVISGGDSRRFFAGNRFYTTAANRMAGNWFPDAITAEEVAACVKASM